MATEKRLIDANVVLAKQFAAGLSDASGNYYGYADVVFADDIENAPTVDAVEVVRCKDCKHYKPQKKSAHWESRTNYCNRIVTIKVQPYDFCSYGGRKEGDGNG